MAEKVLSEQTCKATRPKPEVYYLNDGGGLRLRVRPNGSRSWIFRYSLNAKDMSYSLGSYPVVTLANARLEMSKLRQMVSEGVNLATARKVSKIQQSLDDTSTFRSISVEWLEHNKADWSDHHHTRNMGPFGMTTG